MTNDPVRVKLQQIAGVEPSSHWLEDCRNELRLVTGTTDPPDAILEQILHHDLRDVVRELDNNNNTVNNCTAARELRRAQHQSLQATHNYKAKLPENFRLLVQVEEFLDISVNAEVRLAVGPASTSAPTAVGNQQNRCLKMVYSDGHYHNMENAPPPQTEQQPQQQQQQQQDLYFLAMELSPIPSLSVQSYAGIKVLLTGPMEFRHGMALWHQGNTTVLGGKVDDLVQIQQKALKQAKLVAGVGVDPTIKALIWNPETTGLPEEEDEGEYESRDVTARAPLAPVVQQQQPPPPPMQPPPPRPPATRPLSQTISSSAATINRSHVPLPIASRNPVIPPPSRPTNCGQPSPTPSAHFQRQQHQTPAIPPSTAASTGPAISIARPQAPPASSPFVTAASMMSGQPSAPSSQQQQQRTVPLNPYSSQTCTSSIRGSNHRPTPGSVASRNTASTQSTATGIMSVSSFTPISSASSITSPPLPTTSATTMASTAQRNSSNYPNYLSYDQLYEKVQCAIQDIHAYRQMYGQAFSVQLKQVGSKDYFNIEKRKNRPKGDDKKHEYVMGARFQGLQGGNGPISCRVDSCILEPHFAHPPGEMRKLSKTNKEETNNLVRDGGRKVLAQLQVPRYYEVSLNMSPEEYFKQANDKRQQVLRLCKLL